MKSIKPGRGPSGMSFIGAIFSVVFGIFWTVLAFSMTAGFGLFGVIFPLFGVMFVIMGIINAVYNYKNATGENRFSAYDITDHGEEGDPSDDWIRREYEKEREEGGYAGVPGGFCPFCGERLGEGFQYCPKCGKQVG